MVATTLTFYAAGYGVRRAMALVRTGAALLAIAAVMIPLDVWTLGHNRTLHWGTGAVWFVASTLCLPIYLASHMALRDRTFAILASLAAGSELLATLHLARLPLEWGLCALVVLAIGYLLLARRLSRSWPALAWSLLWTAEAATPLVLLGLLTARFFPTAWHLVDGAHPALSEYAVGGAWWLGFAFFALRARFTVSLRRGEAGLYHYIAAWTLPVAYLLTLTKAPWSAAWYNLCLALLAAGYLAYGYWTGGGRGARAARLLRRPAYQVAILLSIVAALWAIPVRESQIATLLTLSLAYGVAALLLRQHACAYVATYLLPLAYGLILSRLGLTDDIQPLAWAGLTALLLVAAEVAARRTGEGRRSLLATVCGLGRWRSRFASAFFSCGYAVSLIAIGLCLARYDGAPLLAGVRTPALPVTIACSPSSRCTL